MEQVTTILHKNGCCLYTSTENVNGFGCAEFAIGIKSSVFSIPAKWLYTEGGRVGPEEVWEG